MPHQLVPFALLCASVPIVGVAQAQQDYPNRVIRIISPNAPGGGTSLLAQIVGEKLTEAWGKNVVVDNRPGGNGIIGGQALSSALPDGHTLMSMTNTHILTPLLLPTPYDAIRDFAPVATIASSELLLVVHPSVSVNTVKELIALAKARPGQLNFASSGSGSLTHLQAELLNINAGINLQHIPYKGSGQALADLVGGHVQMYFGPPNNALPHIQSGRLKPIAVGGKTRLLTLPNVPTFSEEGIQNVDLREWWGLLAPAATPRPIIDKISKQTALIVARPEVRKKLAEIGMDPFISNPDEFSALMKQLTVRFAEIIKAANIRLEK